VFSLGYGMNNPLLWGEGGEGNNYAFRGRGRGLGSFWGQVVRKYL